MHLSCSRPSSSNLPGQEKREKRENREKSKEKGKRGGETSPISFALGVCVRAVLSPPPVALLQSLLLPFSGLLSGCPLSACLPRLAQIYILPPEFGISFSLCCSIGCACLSCSRIQRQFLKEASHFPLCLASVSLAPSPSFSGNFRKSTMVLWVFGYGSLVWNPGFEFDEKIIGYIKDHRRVFDLACIDHRGTPESPARTLTLEAKKGAICWGAAYCVKGGPEKERLAMKYLENRECEYDLKTQVDFYKDGDSLPAITGVLVFTSTPCNKTNKYYIGPAPLEEMARQIATATGPCGNNREYLFKLEIALYDIGHQEDSVVELANEVRKVLVRLREQRMIGAQLSMKSQLSPVPHISTLPETTVMDSR